VIQTIILQAVSVKSPRHKTHAYPIAHFCQYYLRHDRICECHNCDNLTGVVYTWRPKGNPEKRDGAMWGLAGWETNCGRAAQWWRNIQSRNQQNITQV